MMKRNRQGQETMTPLIKRLSKFLNTTSGLDLTLRLIHGFAFVLAEVLHGRSHAAAFLAAAMQLALGACFKNCHSLKHA